MTHTEYDPDIHPCKVQKEGREKKRLMFGQIDD
jgi:hypothetical protein